MRKHLEWGWVAFWRRYAAAAAEGSGGPRDAAHEPPPG